MWQMKKIILTVASVYAAMICLAVAQSGNGGSASFAAAENINSGFTATSAMARQPYAQVTFAVRVP
jgi:hypothetical protein